MNAFFRKAFCSAIFLSLFTLWAFNMAVYGEPPIDFSRTIKPILTQSCYQCHGPDTQESGMRLDTPEGIATGGKGGPVIVAGNAQESELFYRINLPVEDFDIMPAEGDPLTPGQIELIRLWINQGALFETKETQKSATKKALLTPVKDITLYEDAGGKLSNGSDPHFFVGRMKGKKGSTRRALIAFDIAGNIPAGATIVSASLKLHLSGKPSTPPQVVRLHRVLSNWGEGKSKASVPNDSEGAPAQPGDATWRQPFFTSPNPDCQNDPNSCWQKPGGDFAALVSASQNIAGAGQYTWASNSQMLIDARAWYKNPKTNYGWLLISDEKKSTTAIPFDSRENPSAKHRPQLLIEYIPPVSIF